MKSFIRMISLMLVLLTAAFFPSCGTEGVCVKLNGKTIYTDTPSPAIRQCAANGKADITAINRSDTDISITVYTSSDTPKVELYCEPGEKTSVGTVFEKTDCAVDGIAVIKDTATAYVFTENGLRAAVRDADSVFLLNDISADGDLTLESPVKIHTAGHTLSIGGSIYMSADDRGSFVLNGSIDAAAIYADAPLCDITVPDELVPENSSQRIIARSLNGASVDTTRTVSSESELNALLDANAFPTLRRGSVLVLNGFEITKKQTINTPLSLYLENMTLSASISFDTETYGTISIYGAADPEKIRINAPNCDINWENCGYTVFDAAEKYNALSLNGVSLKYAALGGAAEADLKITLDMGANMTGDAVWQRTAPYTYTAMLTSPAAPSALSNAKLKISTGGTETNVIYDSFCKNDDGSVNLMSPHGASFTVGGARYRLITESQCRLPVVVIDAHGAEIESKEDYIDATISVESDFSADRMPSLDTAEVQIAGRGNTTWYWSSKKPYKLKFKKKTGILGMEAAKDWVLLSNYADKSLIRNYVALETAKILEDIDCYATEYPVDVFIGGEYVGVYTMGEKVESGSGRAYVQDDGTSVDCGFLMELNGGDDGEDGKNIINFPLGNIKIVYPGNRLTDSQAEYIKNYMVSADSAVSRYGDPSSYLDLNSFADFIIMLELSYNSDSCFRRSVFFAKDAGGSLRVSQMWDFDLAFGNSYADGKYDEWACLSNKNYVNTRWSEPLMTNETFKALLREKWNKIKDTLLDTAIGAVDHGEYLVAPSAKANFEKWDIMYLRVGMQPDSSYIHHTFESQTEYLREFIKNRWIWIDKELNSNK